MQQVAVVIIGRNEGKRLEVCLRSVLAYRHEANAKPCTVVYVDSGSSDGSPELARRMGADVVELTPPFTAARGRNAGLIRLLELAPGASFVQFIDGDVELAAGWFEAATRTLEERPDVAVVCGRLRERYVERSIYNRLCDIEWDRPPGETTACGGIAMMRIEAVRKAGSFREDLIAGEEPELCLRLRCAGWKILRLSEEMGWHDAAIVRFSQWWRRSMRAGHGYAQGAWLHGRGPERYRVRELASIGLWGAAIPAAAVGGAPLTMGLSLALLGIYPIQGARLYRQERRRGRQAQEAAASAAFTLLGKFAQAQGVLRCTGDLVRGRASGVIEYKDTGSGPMGTATQGRDSDGESSARAGNFIAQPQR